MVYGLWFMDNGVWFMLYDLCFMFYGLGLGFLAACSRRFACALRVKGLGSGSLKFPL